MNNNANLKDLFRQFVGSFSQLLQNKSKLRLSEQFEGQILILLYSVEHRFLKYFHTSTVQTYQMDFRK